LNALFEKQPKNQFAEIDHFVMAITPGVELAQAQKDDTGMEAWSPGSVSRTGTAARVTAKNCSGDACRCGKLGSDRERAGPWTQQSRED
jgi:hypothetical protein